MQLEYITLLTTVLLYITKYGGSVLKCSVYNHYEKSLTKWHINFVHSRLCIHVIRIYYFALPHPSENR